MRLGSLSGDLDMLKSEFDDVTVTCFLNLAGSQEIIILASNDASITDGGSVAGCVY